MGVQYYESIKIVYYVVATLKMFKLLNLKIEHFLEDYSKIGNDLDSYKLKNTLNSIKRHGRRMRK